MGLPETRYAMSGDVAIAYQIVSDGPFDVVWVRGAVPFEERGTGELKGVPGEWRLYAVAA